MIIIVIFDDNQMNILNNQMEITCIIILTFQYLSGPRLWTLHQDLCVVPSLGGIFEFQIFVPGAVGVLLEHRHT